MHDLLAGLIPFAILHNVPRDRSSPHPVHLDPIVVARAAAWSSSSSWRLATIGANIDISMYLQAIPNTRRRDDRATVTATARNSQERLPGARYPMTTTDRDSLLPGLHGFGRGLREQGSGPWSSVKQLPDPHLASLLEYTSKCVLLPFFLALPTVYLPTSYSFRSKLSITLALDT
jgi:hypothetical protein